MLAMFSNGDSQTIHKIGLGTECESSTETSVNQSEIYYLWLYMMSDFVHF